MRRNLFRTVAVLALVSTVESMAWGAAATSTTSCPTGSRPEAPGVSQGSTPPALPPADWTWERVRELRDPVSGAELALGLDADGLKRSEARFGSVHLVKTVDANRSVHLAVAGEGGGVTVWMIRGRVEVTAGGRTFAVTATTPDSDLLAMRHTLAASPAVQAVRAAVARLSSDVAATVEGADLLVSNALLASLDGDVSALERVGRRLHQWLSAPTVEARFVLQTCYEDWKQEAVHAMNWVEQCYNDFEWWNVVMRDLCFVEWTLRVEAAWFEFLRCLALAPRLPGA